MSHNLARPPVKPANPESDNSLAAVVPLLTHRLRNPLSVIITAASQMQETGAAALVDDDPSYLDAIMTSAEQIEEILKRFSLYACPEPPDIEPADPNELCRIEIANRNAQPHAETSVKIEFNPGDQLLELACDPFQFRIMLSELIDNALRATNGPGTITLSTGHIDRSVIITLEDNGHGLTADQSRQAFQPFYTTWPGKSGLGLAIVQSIIAVHKGTIELESRAGKGTRVTVILPGRDRIKE